MQSEQLLIKPVYTDKDFFPTFTVRFSEQQITFAEGDSFLDYRSLLTTSLQELMSLVQKHFFVEKDVSLYFPVLGLEFTMHMKFSQELNMKDIFALHRGKGNQIYVDLIVQKINFLKEYSLLLEENLSFNASQGAPSDSLIDGANGSSSDDFPELDIEEGDIDFGEEIYEESQVSGNDSEGGHLNSNLGIDSPHEIVSETKIDEIKSVVEESGEGLDYQEFSKSDNVNSELQFSNDEVEETKNELDLPLLEIVNELEASDQSITSHLEKATKLDDQLDDEDDELIILESTESDEIMTSEEEHKEVKKPESLKRKIETIYDDWVMEEMPFKKQKLSLDCLDNHEFEIPSQAVIQSLIAQGVEDSFSPDLDEELEIDIGSFDDEDITAENASA